MARFNNRSRIATFVEEGRKKQAEKPQAVAIASVIFEALISLIKLNLNALIGQRSEKREI